MRGGDNPQNAHFHGITHSCMRLFRKNIHFLGIVHLWTSPFRRDAMHCVSTKWGRPQIDGFMVWRVNVFSDFPIIQFMNWRHYGKIRQEDHTLPPVFSIMGLRPATILCHHFYWDYGASAPWIVGNLGFRVHPFGMNFHFRTMVIDPKPQIKYHQPQIPHKTRGASPIISITTRAQNVRKGRSPEIESPDVRKI